MKADEEENKMEEKEVNTDLERGTEYAELDEGHWMGNHVWRLTRRETRRD